MNENKHIADSIDIAEGKEKYDRHIKIILSDKQILAKILKETVFEFKEISFEKTMECIEGEPEVGTVPVYPGKTNLPSEAITGLPTEDKVPNEGDITFDIRFYAVTPDGDKVKLIINVEAQKKYHVGYDSPVRITMTSKRSTVSGSVWTQPKQQPIRSPDTISTRILCTGQIQPDTVMT